MPDKKTAPKAAAKSNRPGSVKAGKKYGMHHASMPHIPGAMERARTMDSNRRFNAQTFEL